MLTTIWPCCPSKTHSKNKLSASKIQVSIVIAMHLQQTGTLKPGSLKLPKPGGPWPVEDVFVASFALVPWAAVVKASLQTLTAAGVHDPVPCTEERTASSLAIRTASSLAIRISDGLRRMSRDPNFLDFAVSSGLRHCSNSNEGNLPTVAITVR